ncbi:MAG: hypothetical protein ACT4QE_18535 [Anaerolineales bacterium]
MNFDQLGFDWIVYAYPALMTFVSGGDPYTVVPNFVNPPWMLLLLSPLSLITPLQGVVILGVITVTGLVALCGRSPRASNEVDKQRGEARGARKLWLAIPLAISFPMMTLLWHGQVDGVILWGLTLGGPFGLLLLAAKPQAAVFVGLIWAMQAWREGGWKQAARLVLPVVIAAVVSAFLYPSWVRAMLSASAWAHTTNGFPWSLALGAGVLVSALRGQREDLAALATVLLAPYTNVQSWVPAMALLSARYQWEVVAACAASWLIPIWLLAHR